MTAKDGLLTFKCVNRNKMYQKYFNENLSQRYENANQFCDGGINKFCLMLQEGVYSYEYLDNWERFNETLLRKREFYSNLTVESITDTDYRHAKRVWGDFGLQNLGRYPDLYVQSGPLLLPDIFESFRNKCLEI